MVSSQITPARADDAHASPWTDLDAYVATPRLTGLRLSSDGRRLVVGVAALDGSATAYRTAWWSADPDGLRPARRLTRSVDGEATAAFLPDGDLLFTSARALPADGSADPAPTEEALWCLPAAGGEAYVAARRDGGWGSVLAARSAPVAVLWAPTHAGTADAGADRTKRAGRRERKINAILHDGYPVRHWDHDLGLEAPRLAGSTSPGRAPTGRGPRSPTW